MTLDRSFCEIRALAPARPPGVHAGRGKAVGDVRAQRTVHEREEGNALLRQVRRQGLIREVGPTQKVTEFHSSCSVASAISFSVLKSLCKVSIL